jgi:hypothetical protein
VLDYLHGEMAVAVLRVLYLKLFVIHSGWKPSLDQLNQRTTERIVDSPC